MFLPHPRVKVSIVGSLRDREVACSASDRQGSNFESCVWRTVSSQSSHHPQEVLLAQFSLYVHKGGLKPESFHFYLVFRESAPMTLRQKWNDSGFRPLLCTYRLSWARRTSRGWWDEWDDTALLRNSSPGGLRPSTLLLGHGGSPQYWVLRVDGEETFWFLSNHRDRETNPELWRDPETDQTVNQAIYCVD